MDIVNKIYNEDCLVGLRKLPDNSIDCCVTSPPYFGQRDYHVDGQIGLEKSPRQYIETMTEVFAEVYRVLKPEGTLWLNMGDGYAQSGTEGLKVKDLIGMPWAVAFSLRDKVGFYLRNDIIWEKGNCVPESVTDRLTKSHEYIFLMTKSMRYYFDHEAIQEPAISYDGRKDIYSKGSPKYQENVMPNHKRADLANTKAPKWHFKNLQEKGQTPNTMHLRRADGLPDKQYPMRNKRDVWMVNTKPNKESHFAVYPDELIRPCILAGCPRGGIVLDPFMGSGTTARVARKYGRKYLGFELNPEYIKIIEQKVIVSQDLFM
jgi:DNA modification methylase